MYDRILVPTDGSVGTTHVALQAIDLAQQYDATVHVVHVVDTDVRSLVRSATGSTVDLEDLGRRAVERIERMAEDHGLIAETEILEGDPAETILSYADDIDADLVVAGTHGRSGVERRIIGSVAERLVRGATCPVMTVRLPETDVTIQDEDHAVTVAQDALESAGYDTTITGVERQLSVWIVEAESDRDDAAYLVYVDPETQRTSIISRE